MSKKLNILVPIKRVIDHQLAPRLSATNKTQITIPSYSINPFDDIAIEECIKLKEKHKDLIDKIKVVTISSDPSQTNKLKDILYKSLAKGCNEAKIIEVEGVAGKLLQPLTVANILKKEVLDNSNNLVILGKQAIDEDNNNVGQMLAGLLNWPQATNAAKVEILDESAGKIQVHREVDSGEEIVKATWPMVISTDLRLNVPRYATLPKIMKAKKQKIEISKIKLDAELSKINEAVKVLEYNEPEKRQPGIKVDSVDELLAKLKETKAI
ncbi:hypothetical protein ACO0RG_000923 [Hanseniaspora osmophila]|uniref:Probable electron transfer flavoprotein subunit beta n=1 Tax=Hanseniaspora osmophila TaxID=56408 RepID=A0A1E5R2J5_9ASCO|nr:putative electron transfer flavoprotein subunit beta [Hanseniaspora osmophila]